MPRAADPNAVYREVAAGIRRRIRSGDYRPGQALPTSRVLACMWGTSVFTIQKAINILAAEGLIIAKPRSMRVVAASAGPPPVPACAKCGPARLNEAPAFILEGD